MRAKGALLKKAQNEHPSCGSTPLHYMHFLRSTRTPLNSGPPRRGGGGGNGEEGVLFLDVTEAAQKLLEITSLKPYLLLLPSVCLSVSLWDDDIVFVVIDGSWLSVPFASLYCTNRGGDAAVMFSTVMLNLPIMSGTTRTTRGASFATEECSHC